MGKDTYHVLPNSKGGWSLIKRGNINATRTFDNEINAGEYGEAYILSHNANLVIHKRDGSVQERVVGNVEKMTSKKVASKKVASKKVTAKKVTAKK